GGTSRCASVPGAGLERVLGGLQASVRGAGPGCGAWRVGTLIDALKAPKPAGPPAGAPPPRPLSGSERATEALRQLVRRVPWGRGPAGTGSAKGPAMRPPPGPSGSDHLVAIFWPTRIRSGSPM